MVTCDGMYFSKSRWHSSVFKLGSSPNLTNFLATVLAYENQYTILEIKMKSLSDLLCSTKSLLMPFFSLFLLL